MPSPSQGAGRVSGSLVRPAPLRFEPLVAYMAVAQRAARRSASGRRRRPLRVHPSDQVGTAHAGLAPRAAGRTRRALRCRRSAAEPAACCSTEPGSRRGPARSLCVKSPWRADAFGRTRRVGREIRKQEGMREVDDCTITRQRSYEHHSHPTCAVKNAAKNTLPSEKIVNANRTNRK